MSEIRQIQLDGINYDLVITEDEVSATAAAQSAAQAAQSATQAAGSVDAANNKALDAEAVALGTRNGNPISSSDPYYQNNAKYYKDQAQAIVGLTVDTALSSTSTNPVENRVITNALNNIDALPSQSGQSGKFLTTNGSVPSWANIESVDVEAMTTSEIDSAIGDDNGGGGGEIEDPGW